MRQHVSEGFQLIENNHPFIFKNAQGHTITITFVSTSVARVQYLTDKQGTSSNNTTTFQNVHVQNSKEDGSSLEFQTTKIRLVVTLLPAFQLKWYSIEGNSPEKPFAEDLSHRSYSYDKVTSEKWHYQCKYDDTLYYGLGERTGTLNLSGRSFSLERLDCMGYDAETQDPLYKFCPFYIGLDRSTKRAYGVYYNSFTKARIDFGQELDAMWGTYTYYTPESGPIDYYMIYGPKVSSVVHNYTLITGSPRNLPPRYSFGYLASSMGYAESDDAQKKIEEFAENCKKYEIPCDGIHLSSGYTVNDEGDRCVFTWNRTRFPDPEGLAKTLKASGIHIFANVKPWLLKESHPDYDQLKRDMGLVWNEDGPGDVMQWRSGRNTMGIASYIDFTSQVGYEYWMSHLKSELLDKGFLLWLDNNEFTAADDGHSYACEVSPDQFLGLLKPKTGSIYGPKIPKERSEIKEAGTPLQTLLMIQASYQALQRHDPIQRPFLITRSATPYSNQLVSQTWSGDNTTSWKTVKYNIPMGLNASLSGMPAGYGHDVGGFSGPCPDPEMLVRWVQQGIFWPRFCVHSWNTDNTVTELWMFPDVLPIIRSCLEFRYKLIPYLYTLYVHHVYYGSEPLIRPVFYDHQHDMNTYEQQFDFMLGPSLLIAPIYQPGETARSVYLPSNTAWYHYQTGKYYGADQEQWVNVPASLKDEAAPLLIKAGSLICFGKAMKNVHESADDDRRVQIFPERSEDPNVTKEFSRKTLVLYEDDGDTMYHELGNAYAEIHIWMEESETEIHVGLEIVKDGFFPYYDTIWVTCPIASETRRLIFEVPDEELGLIENLPGSQLSRFVDDKDNCVYYGLKLPVRKTIK
ncbi:unnamed protein product [Rhizopus stolonifer]